MRPIFENIHSGDSGYSKLDPFDSLAFEIYDSSGPNARDLFTIQGVIKLPSVSQSSALAVLSDSSQSYMWMISDEEAAIKCKNYLGSKPIHFIVNVKKE